MICFLVKKPILSCPHAGRNLRIKYEIPGCRILIESIARGFYRRSPERISTSIGVSEIMDMLGSGPSGVVRWRGIEYRE